MEKRICNASVFPNVRPAILCSFYLLENLSEVLFCCLLSCSGNLLDINNVQKLTPTSQPNAQSLSFFTCFLQSTISGLTKASFSETLQCLYLRLLPLFPFALPYPFVKAQFLFYLSHKIFSNSQLFFHTFILSFTYIIKHLWSETIL